MSTISNEIKQDWPTLYELGQEIMDIDVTLERRVGRPPQTQFKSIVEGLNKESFPTNEGTFIVTPEQVASLKVPLLEKDENGHLLGFQRELSPLHARRMAKSMLDGKEMSTVKVSILPDGQPYVTDGMHTSVAAIISRHPVEVTVKRRTVEEARELFGNQRLAKKITQDQVILSGSSAIEFYVQDAATTDDHIWSPFVGMGTVQGGTARKMSPTAAVLVIGQFAFNTLNMKVNYMISRNDDEFSLKRADQMARLLSAFGTKSTNEFAFRSGPLRAISTAAVHIFLRNPNARPSDEARWMKHMASFDFSQYPHLLSKSHGELTVKLIDHWNKRLSDDRKVRILSSK